MEQRSITKNDVIANPELINEWCSLIVEVEKLDPQKAGIRAKQEFSDTWSASKIQKLVDPKFKVKSQQQNVKKKKSKPITKKKWMKKFGKGILIGAKRGWISLAEDIALPAQDTKTFLDK